MVERRIPTREEVLSYLHEKTNWGRWGKDDQIGAINMQYCGQNLGRLFGNNTIVAKGFVLRAGFFQTQPVS